MLRFKGLTGKKPHAFCATLANNLLSLFSLMQVVGQALIGTLQDGLGEEFTKEVKEAYLTFYGMVTKNMKDGLNEAYLEQED